MGCDEYRRHALNVSARFTNDLKVADHGILNELVCKKGSFVQVFSILVNPRDGLKDMRQIVSQAQNTTTHTGRASEITIWRKVSGKASGVNTSTGTPSRLRNL